MCGKFPTVYTISPSSVVIPRDIYLRMVQALIDHESEKQSDLEAAHESMVEDRWTGGSFEVSQSAD